MLPKIEGVDEYRYMPIVFANGPRQACFTRHVDGTVTVDDWCRRQWFGSTLLADGAYRDLGIHYAPHIAGGIVTIEVANGRAVYKIISAIDDDPTLVCGELVQAEIDMPLTKAGGRDDQTGA